MMSLRRFDCDGSALDRARRKAGCVSSAIKSDSRQPDHRPIGGFSSDLHICILGVAEGPRFWAVVMALRSQRRRATVSQASADLSHDANKKPGARPGFKPTTDEQH